MATDLTSPALTNRKPYELLWCRTPDGGAMLSTWLWWLGAVNPSEAIPGQWHWKIADTGVDHYCDTREQAIAECQAAALAQRDHDGRGYVLVGGTP